MVASASVCCRCRIDGRPVQLHHIDGDRSNADPDNFAVLCLDCHHETQITGGFARRLSAAQVRQYRDQWATAVAEQVRERARDIGRRAASGNPVVGGNIERTDDVIDRVLEEAERSPRLAVRQMEAVLERELLALMYSSGWGQERSDWTIATILPWLYESGQLSTSIATSWPALNDVREAIASGAAVDRENLLSVLDQAILTYRAVAAIARERHYVLQPNIPMFRDEHGREMLDMVWAISLRSIGSRPRPPMDRTFVTRRNDYDIGVEVAWEWATRPTPTVLQGWYEDPLSGTFEPLRTVEFVGVRLDTLI
jgi:hypothetical protein